MSISVFELTAGQQLEIGDGICVRISDVNQRRVRFEIEAPNSVSVQRGEFAEMLRNRLEEEGT